MAELTSSKGTNAEAAVNAAPHIKHLLNTETGKVFRRSNCKDEAAWIVQVEHAMNNKDRYVIFHKDYAGEDATEVDTEGKPIVYDTAYLTLQSVESLQEICKQFGVSPHGSSKFMIAQILKAQKKGE